MLLLIVFMMFTLMVIVNGQNRYCDLRCDNGDHSDVHTVCERDRYKCGPNPNKCGKNFEIVRLTDDQRQTILNVHNGLRCRISLGKETRGNQPSASNMRVLSYDRELEFISQCWANECNGVELIHDRCRRTQQFDHVGQNLGYINSSADNINDTVAMEQLIRLWYDEVAIFNKEWVLDTRDRGPNVVVGHYTQMMWAATHRLGCAAVRYTMTFGQQVSYVFSFVCNYGPGGNYIGFPVYKPGKAGTECPFNLSHSNKCGMCGNFVNVRRSDEFRPIFEL